VRHTLVDGDRRLAWSAARAFQTAEAAGAAARAARLGFVGPISSWDDLGVYGPLMRIPAHQLRRDILPAELRLLLDVDRDDNLASTLRAYLDAGCSAQAAAEALAIHRTTLYYRLRRVEELTGLDLSDGRVRVSLHVGLILLDIMQASRPNP
jgi:DNA-binding PucR family transcriptional regulator